MRASFVCTFVCLSALFLKGSEAVWDGFVAEGVTPKLEDVFKEYFFSKDDAKSFFSKNPQGEGFLRTGKDSVTESEEGKRTAVTISAVMDDLRKNDKEMTLPLPNPIVDAPKIDIPLIIFASKGLKGVAAIRFAMAEKQAHPNRNIAILLPDHIVKTSGAGEAFKELEAEQEFINLKKDNIRSEIEAFKYLLKADSDFENALIIEALFGIGFEEKWGINPESYPVMEFFFELAKVHKVFTIDVPAFYNVDAGMPNEEAVGNNNAPAQSDAKNIWPLTSTVPAKEFEAQKLETLQMTQIRTGHYGGDGKLLEESKKTLLALNGQINSMKTFKGEDYKPNYVLFIGFLKPCYTGLLELPELKHIYLGGHFLPKEAVEKLIALESVKGRYPDMKFEDFPTYSPKKLSFKLK